MARPTDTKPSGKGKHPNGKKHLNASLPQQLVFDFNAIAKKQGHGRRDALVEDLLRSFLEKVEPNSKALRKPASSSFSKHMTEASVSGREKFAYRRQVAEQEAIRISRERAEEILAATSDFTTRKPPKQAVSATSRASRKRRA